MGTLGRIGREGSPDRTSPGIDPIPEDRGTAPEQGQRKSLNYLRLFHAPTRMKSKIKLISDTEMKRMSQVMHSSRDGARPGRISEPPTCQGGRREELQELRSEGSFCHNPLPWPLPLSPGWKTFSVSPDLVLPVGLQMRTKE